MVGKQYEVEATGALTPVASYTPIAASIVTATGTTTSYTDTSTASPRFYRVRVLQ